MDVSYLSPAQRQDPALRNDLTDREWDLIAPMMPAAVGRPRKWPLGEIMNAIFYVMRGGIDRRLLPSDFPPRSAVFRWFRLFRDTCLFEKINHRLLIKERERSGREASPTASIIDSQSIKTCESGDLRRYGAGPLLQTSRRPFPFIRKVFADTGYQGPRLAEAPTIVVEIVKRT
jgi:transposase